MFVQIVKFRLKHNHSRDLFLGLAEQMTAWLKQQPGFVSYELYEGAECWMDRIAWDEKVSAETGLKEFLTTAIAQKILPLVESDYSSFLGYAVVSG